MPWTVLARMAGAMLIAAVIGCTPVFAEDDNDPVAEKAITAFVDGIRTSNAAAVRATMAPEFNARSQTIPQYAILGKLGPIKSASIEKVFFAGKTAFSADLVHAHGSSSWQFRLDDNGKLIAAQLLEAAQTKTAGPETKPTIVYGGGRHHRRASRSRVVVQDSCDKTPSLCTPAGDQGYDPRLVEFFYATDRNITVAGNTATLDTDSGRLGRLSYGLAAVHIPKDHEPGKIELPSEWRLFGIDFKSSSDSDKHFSIRRLASVALEDWKGLVQKKNESSGQKSALVFVHGFNTGFEEALFRNAQIVWDLGYQGVSVLYSWSSKGKVRDYVYDRDSTDIAQPGFISLLETLRDLGIEHVNVIAHSMGNQLVLKALSDAASKGKPVKLDQLIMAAPDVARDAFQLFVPIVQKLAEGTTLYASSSDRALIASSGLADFPRAGFVPPEGPVVLPKMDTIDVTRVGDDVLGLNHSVFASNRAVMDDLKLLIIDGMKLPRLSQVRRAPEPPQQPTYWKYQ